MDQKVMDENHLDENHWDKTYIGLNKMWTTYVRIMGRKSFGQNLHGSKVQRVTSKWTKGFWTKNFWTKSIGPSWPRTKMF